MSEIIKEFKKGDLLHIDKDGKAQWGFPEGYPHKENQVTVDLSSILESDYKLVKISNELPDPINLGNSVKLWFDDGDNFIVDFVVKQHDIFYIDELALLIVYNSNALLPIPIIFPEEGIYVISRYAGHYISGIAWNPDATHPDITWDGVIKNITTIDSTFLPIATTTTHGAVKQMPYLPNATGDAPTVENFNQLLRELKNAGLMK